MNDLRVSKKPSYVKFDAFRLLHFKVLASVLILRESMLTAL